MKSEVDREYWRRFLKLLLQCKKEDMLEELLQLFLTMNEREYLISRYQIIESLLTTKQTQREIAKKLQVSITKITDGSKAVQIISEDLKEFLHQEMKKRIDDVKKSPRKIASEAKSHRT